jgi:hypothetical protein
VFETADLNDSTYVCWLNSQLPFLTLLSRYQCHTLLMLFISVFSAHHFKETMKEQKLYWI